MPVVTEIVVRKVQVGGDEVNEEDVIRIISFRCQRVFADDQVSKLIETDGCLDIMDKNDRVDAVKDQKKFQEEMRGREEVRIQAQKKMAYFKKAKGKPATSEDGAALPTENLPTKALTTEDFEKLLPRARADHRQIKRHGRALRREGQRVAFVWENNKIGAWMGDYQDNNNADNKYRRVSKRFTEAGGNYEAAVWVLRSLWSQYLDDQKLTWSACFVQGLFNGGEQVKKQLLEMHTANQLSYI